MTIETVIENLRITKDARQHFWQDVKNRVDAGILTPEQACQYSLAKLNWSDYDYFKQVELILEYCRRRKG